MIAKYPLSVAGIRRGCKEPGRVCKVSHDTAPTVRSARESGPHLGERTVHAALAIAVREERRQR